MSLQHIKKYLILTATFWFSCGTALPETQKISALLEDYEKHPFNQEGIETADKAKEMYFLSLEKEALKLYEEAYLLEEFDKEKAIGIYNKILNLLDTKNNLYQKTTARIKDLVE